MFTRNRLFEWVSTLMMWGIALTILWYPHTVATSSFHWLLILGFNSDHLMISFIGFGACRAGALVANGRWPVIGPVFRAVGAVGGAFLWFTLALSLYQMSYETDTLSLGVPVYAALTIGEIFSVFRAGTDVRPRSR